MGNKGPTRHLKRHASPSLWPIPRKTGTWAIRTSSGTHRINDSIPLTIILRNELNYAETAKEAKIIAKEGRVLIDGKIRRDEKFPVGLMDVISLPLSGEHYRVLPEKGGRLKLIAINEEEARVKLCKIVGKTTIKGGKTQINLHDGKNLILVSEEKYKVNDVIKISLPEKEIKDHIEYKEMQQAIIIGGKSQGSEGILIGFGPEPGWKKTATIRTPEGEDVRTLSRYVFVVGSNSPIIKLHEGEE